MPETSNPCQVGLNVVECKAPAGGSQSARAECFACGGRVCTECSHRINYLRYGKRRICNDCIEQQVNADEAAAHRRAERAADELIGASC